MSATNEREIALIRDEDLLKKMWQETEDFGKKKEIRSHMYKLREARLKDLYNSNEVKDVQISSNTKTSFNQSTHADSLADHSFASLKSKEIRDSESPTRDVSYRITGSTNNQGWNVSKVDERSIDGKTHRIIQSAQTSGSEIIPKGKLDFDAKCKQEVTSFQDGDDRNFVRSQGSSSNTVMRQEAVGGDENSSFKSSTTKSSSSSKKVTEQKVSYDDSVDYLPHKQVPAHQDNVIQRSVKVYDTDAPKELKNHPGYVEGHTKITRETKTLADGTVVTTTKYETTGANEIKSSFSNQYSSSNSASQENKSNLISSSHGERYSNKKNLFDRENVPIDQSRSKSRYYVEKTHNIPDNSANSYQNVQSSCTTNVHHQTYENNEQREDATSKRNANERYGIVITDATNDQSTNNQINEAERRPPRQEKYQVNAKNVSNRTEDLKNEIVNSERIQHNTTTHQDVNSVPLGTPIEIEIDVSRININDKRKVINEKYHKQSQEFSSKSPDNKVHRSPQKGEPIKPTDSEWKTKTKPTDNQYETTYRTDYTNKRISVDLSPTHEAFARSLRAVSPDRLSSRSSSRNLKNSSSSLRSSSSPEKSFVDHGQPSRISPERQRCYSPTKRTPERLSSTETITYKSRPSIERTSPHSSQKIKHTSETRVTASHSDVINKKKKSLDETTNVSITTKSTRMSPTKSPSRSSIPNKPGYYKTTREITTDLDDNISTISNTTITKTERIRPTTLEYSTTNIEESIKAAQFSPTNNSISKENSIKETQKKDKPNDRPLKRSDTYEERCRQILGIANTTTERRRSSLEKLKRRGSANTGNNDIFSRVNSDQPTEVKPGNRNSPPKQNQQSKEESPSRKIPNKQKSPLQEFPAQIRRSPEKVSKSHEEPMKSPNKKSPDRQSTQEFPSKLGTYHEEPKSTARKSPSKETKSFENKSPKKEATQGNVRKYPSESRKSPEHNKVLLQSPKKSPQDIKNEILCEDETHRNIAHSTTHKCTRVDFSEARMVTNYDEEPSKIPDSQNYKPDGPDLTEKPHHYQDNLSDDLIDKNLKTQPHEKISAPEEKLINVNRNRPTEVTPKVKPSTTITTRETSPLKDYASQTRHTSLNDEVNSTFIKQEAINQRISHTNRSIDSSSEDLKAQENIYEKTSVPREELEDVDYSQSIKERATPKSIIPKTSSTSPLTEYPSQTRRTSGIDGVNSEILKQERNIHQVPSEVLTVHVSQTKISSKEKRPTSETLISSEIAEDDGSQLTITEITDEYTTEEIAPAKKQPKTYHKSTPEDDDMKFHLTKIVDDNSDITSITGATTVTKNYDVYTSSNRIHKPNESSQPNSLDTVNSENKASIENVIIPGQTSSTSHLNTSKQMERNELKSVRNEIKNIDTKIIEDSPKQTQFLDSRKSSQRGNTNSHPGKPKSSKHHPPKQADTSLNIAIIATDIIYTNGDTCEENFVADKIVSTRPAVQKTIHDLGSQNELHITETTNVRKNKQPSSKDPKLKESKRTGFPVKDKPLEKTPERKTTLTSKITNREDVTKHKGKPSQKIPNYSSKISHLPLNVQKHIQKDNEDLIIKKQSKSDVDVDSSSEGEIEEIHNKKYVKETYEGKTPVEEPLVIKKKVSLLYSDDEDDKKNTQMFIESEIIDKQPTVDKKKDKPAKSPKITSSKFIVNEKKDLNSRSTQSPSKPSPKSVPRSGKNPLIEKNQNEPKINGETEYTDKYNRKVVQSKQENSKRQSTLSDSKHDTSTHKKFHKIDDVVKKTKSSTPKVESVKKPIDISPKKQISPKVPTSELPRSKIASRNKTVVEKSLQCVKTKSNELSQHAPKVMKPSNKLKHIVSTTILLKPKTETSTVNSVSSKRINDYSKTIPSALKTKNIIKPEESDDESIPDSLNETINDNESEIVSKHYRSDTEISKSTPSRYILSPERRTPTRNQPQPELIEEKPKITKPKLEKRCISTKSIIINNTDRGITVDLQRSISSREPTPDRVCPLPVTSDDDGVTPRFPDKVVEPDDSTFKRNSNRLFETIIQENDDKEVRRIVEITDDINQKVTEVDKVERNDDSLLTVNKKISKFLTTADRLTEKSIMDISQPAPKVERQKFEVTEDLKEDDCLLSVSDKVNKFINEAEHLTSQNKNQTRKSVNLGSKTEIPKKANTFSLTQEVKFNRTSPSKTLVKNYGSDDIFSSTTSNKDTKIETVVDRLSRPEPQDSMKSIDQIHSTIHQDVFITTECDQIEKENDSFRSSKRLSKSIHTEDEPQYPTTPSEITQHRVPNLRPQSRQSQSPEKDSTGRCSPVRKLTTETTAITRKNFESSKRNEQEIQKTPRTRNPAKDDSFKKFTPKNRRPSQEEKVILSTVGRLRSSESIKRAKAIFENGRSTDKDDKIQKDINIRQTVFEGKNISSKEITRKPIDKSNLTPKRLDFPANDESSTKESTHIKSHVKYPSLKTQKPDEQNIPGYMKPLHRSVEQHSPQKEQYQPIEIHERQEPERFVSEGREIPGYMKPLNRSARPHSPAEEQLYESEIHGRYESKESISTEKIPGYMKPIDRSSRLHSPQREIPHPLNTHEKHNYEESDEELPHYMKPLSPHSHRRENEDLFETHQSLESREQISPGEVPGYMKPLTSHSHQEDNFPAYQVHPTHESKTTTMHHRKTHSNLSEIPHSLEPTESDSTEELPGYMRPLTPHTHQSEYLQTTETHHTLDTRESIATDDDLPGYMKPLESHIHAKEHLHPTKTHQDHEPKRQSLTDERLGYLKSPVTSQSHQKVHLLTSNNYHNHEPKRSIPIEYSESKTPTDRSLRGHSPQKEDSHPFRSPENHEFTRPLCADDIPGYMKPLERANRPQSPKRDAFSGKKSSEHVGTPTKFGVTLKRTDSSKGVTSTNLTSSIPKKHPILSEKNITEEDIERVFELEVLEELLLVITGYELRRQIRAQIRYVKKLISEGKLEVTIQNIRNKSTEQNQLKETTKIETKHRENKDKFTRQTSPSKKSNDNKYYDQRDVIDRTYNEKSSEYVSSYTRKESTNSFSRSESPGSRSSKSPERKSPQRKSPTRATTEEYVTHKNVSSTNQSTNKNSVRQLPVEQTTKTTNIFKSSLKKTEPKTKTPVTDVQPEWASQRNLKKVNSNDIEKKTTVSTSNTRNVKKQTVRSSSPTKDAKPTDVITSSYGVGPTDENGTPLFGLKALRAQNNVTNTKVQGTVISSQYYSETGKEPVGQISFTKYSSDPRDLGSNENLTNQDGGILSVTTTQKFGFDDAPSLKQLTNTKRDICDVQTDKRTSTSKSSTVTRRNSVKALTQKFVENAVEASKNEQQSSYPKAGLILRSSSFKNESTRDTPDDYNEVTAEERTQKSVSVMSTNSRVVSGGTFLRNKSKVTGIQDVVTRMKAEDVEAGDTSEDIEARGLLNKYLGSQTILSGIEGQISDTTTSTARVASCSTSTKSTTKVTTVIMENGKEVKKTRTFEHPIPNEVLETVWDEQTIRYLLDQSTDYEERKRIRARLRLIMSEQDACTELVKQASQDQSGQSVDGEFLLLPLLQGLLDAPENEQTHDSGTESGEDQRSGLIAEVQNALEKLSSNLRSDTTDITPERRSSLLQLVTKLQVGLTSASSDRRHSAQLRFNRRRERPDRHTVGVSNEELADARRLMEEISCPSQYSSRTSLIPKQNSESNVGHHNCSYTLVNTIPQKSTVKNSTAKPFSCSNSASVSSTSSSVQTPSESTDCIGYLFNEDNKDYVNANESSIVHDNMTKAYLQDNPISNRILTTDDDNLNQKSENIIVESEEDDSTVKMPDKFTLPNVVMQNNPLYYQQQPNNDKMNRYTAKKLRMRRANTIDIPKPLHFYECDDEDETDYEDEERRRRSTYLALRGPIRIGNDANRNSMPVLEPKTENDKKFLAFIKKHNEKNQRHSLWAGNADNHFRWNHKFDHLRTNFENKIDNGPVSPNSARSFWKSTDDSIKLGSNKYDPKISKQSARNLKKMFEEKQKQNRENIDQSNVVTGFLKLAPKVDSEKNYHPVPQPLPVNKFSHAPSSAFQPVNRNLTQQDLKENFKPQPLEIIKSVISANDSESSDRLFLYSPKPLQNKGNITPTSPSSIKPWVGNSGEGRVLALAAKKFENPVFAPNTSFEPRKLSKEKINAFPNFQESVVEKLTAPYLVKYSDQKLSTVRKLSGQYDSIGSQINKFKQSTPVSRPNNIRNIEGFEAKFTIPQNYCIKYDRPKVQLHTQKLPLEEHRTIPSEIKKYNQMQHIEKSDAFNQYALRPTETMNTQETKKRQPHQQSHYDDKLPHETMKAHHPVTEPPFQVYQLPQSYSRVQENVQTSQFPKFENKKQSLVTSRVNYDTAAQVPYNDFNNTPVESHIPMYNTQKSVESLKEYDAISSRVMSGPVAQVAATFRQKSPLTRNEHDMEAAFNLRNVLQKVGNSPNSNLQSQLSSPKMLQVRNEKTRDKVTQENSNRTCATTTELGKQNCQIRISPSIPENTYTAKVTQNKFKPLSESCEVTAEGEHIVIGKFPIPTINMKSREVSFSRPSHSQVLSKSDSWHQICLVNQGNLHKPSAKSSSNARGVMKSKSTHSMIPAKQFEAGMTKDEIMEKKKTLEAFFGGHSPQPSSCISGKVVKRAINRTKTSEKNSQYKQSQTVGMTAGLARSRTLPDIARPDLLDESNVDKAFEDLFSSS